VAVDLAPPPHGGTRRARTQLIQRARRAAQLFFRLSDDLLPDIGRLLRGNVEIVRQTRLLAISVVTGQERAVSLDELAFLSQLPTDRWTPIAELMVDPGLLQSLALEGFVVCDEDSGELAELRRRDDRLAESGWSPYAALYHSQSRWRDVDIACAEGRRPSRKPPPAFHAVPEALGILELPLSQREDGLFRRLVERKTTRSFDPQRALARDDLSTLLYYTFGCHAYTRVADEIALLKKTSPSGGSLHPVEVYPLAIDVEELEAGLYHYRADRHALELVERLDADTARERAVLYLAGQTYFASAKVLLILAARFPRSFWKYRSSTRALAVLFMDAAHLSQTLYLVCEELGLGAFVSAAVNSANIEDDLRLDAFEQGVLAVCGCGPPAGEPSAFDPQFEPYVPRTTEV
jgi:putative peptide maturation dehydrogenase